MHNKCNARKSSSNHPYRPPVFEKLSSMKLVPKRLGITGLKKQIERQAQQELQLQVRTTGVFNLAIPQLPFPKKSDQARAGHENQ